MRKVKTIKGFIGLLKQVAISDVECFKGYDKLTEEQKNVLKFARGDAYNTIGDIASGYEKINKANQ